MIEVGIRLAGTIVLDLGHDDVLPDDLPYLVLLCFNVFVAVCLCGFINLLGIVCQVFNVPELAAVCGVVKRGYLVAHDVDRIWHQVSLLYDIVEFIVGHLQQNEHDLASQVFVIIPAIAFGHGAEVTVPE